MTIEVTVHDVSDKMYLRQAVAEFEMGDHKGSFTNTVSGDMHIHLEEGPNKGSSYLITTGEVVKRVIAALGNGENADSAPSDAI